MRTLALLLLLAPSVMAQAASELDSLAPLVKRRAVGSPSACDAGLFDLMTLYRNAWRSQTGDDSYVWLPTSEGCASYRRYLARDTSKDAANGHADFVQFAADEVGPDGVTPLHDSPAAERDYPMFVGGGGQHDGPLCFVVYRRSLPCFYDTMCVPPQLPGDDEQRPIVVRLPQMRHNDDLVIADKPMEGCHANE